MYSFYGYFFSIFNSTAFTNIQVLGLVVISVVVDAKVSTISILIYVLLGTVSSPVFANFSSGFAAIAGPTGGYIVGLIIDYIIETLQLKIITGISVQTFT